jgi:hypothetical protein
MSSPASRRSAIECSRRRGGHSEKLKSFNGSRRPTGRWLFWNLESSHESSCETASKSPCGPTSNRCSIKTFHRMTTRTQSSVFITPCGRSVSRHRTSPIESRTCNGVSHVAMTLRISPTRIGSAARPHDRESDAVDRRSRCRGAAAPRRAPPVECAEHEDGAALRRFRELCQRPGRVRSRLGAQKQSASAIRALTKVLSTSAGASYSRSSQRTAGVEATTSPAGNQESRS